MFDGKVTKKLLDGIVDYCKDNLIAEGWMGKFGITPRMRDELMATSPDFKNTMELIPYISRDTINCLTRTISSQLATDGLDRTDMDKIKLSTALLGKQMEFIYKMEKDTGMFKDEADIRRKRTVHSEHTIGLDDIEDLKELIKGGTNVRSI